MAFRIDSERGVFPDGEFCTFLLDKKVNNYRVEFFIHAGRPYWSIFQLIPRDDQANVSIDKLAKIIPMPIARPEDTIMRSQFED